MINHGHMMHKHVANMQRNMDRDAAAVSVTFAQGIIQPGVSYQDKIVQSSQGIGRRQDSVRGEMSKRVRMAEVSTRRSIFDHARVVREDIGYRAVRVTGTCNQHDDSTDFIQDRGR